MGKGPNISKHTLLVIITLLFFLIAGLVISHKLYIKHHPSFVDKSRATVPRLIVEPTPDDNRPNPVPDTLQQLKTSVLLNVPFTPQAPTANWDTLHNDACEEASIIMVANYFNAINLTNHTNLLSPTEVESEITNLTTWQTNILGYFLNSDTYETARMITEVYKLNTTILPYNEELIKTGLSNENKLFIVPVNGRLLNNPFYKPPGPLYHMLVITGYDQQNFITNDPGTKRGFSYTYDFATIKNAVGHWDHAQQQVDLSNPLMIVVSQKPIH